MNRTVLLVAAFGLCLVLIAAGAALAVPGTAVVGTIEATIGGTPYAGETLEVPAEGTATAEFRDFGGIVVLSIQGHDPASDRILHNVLSLTIDLMGADASAAILGASVLWLPEGMSQPFYTSDDAPGEVAVSWDALSLDADAAMAAGSFSADLCRRDGIMGALDPDDCLAVEGMFETRLRAAD